MKMRIEIDCDNAAFVDNPNELGNILRHLGRLSDQNTNLDQMPIFDINGNHVGLVEIDM